MINIKQCIGDILTDGLVDDVGAYWIAAVVRRNGASDPTAVRSAAIAVIRRVLESGLMRIGDINVLSVPQQGSVLRPVAFRQWTESPAEAVARVEREWDGAVAPLGWYPEPGALCWLVNTESGDAMARRLLAGDIAAIDELP